MKTIRLITIILLLVVSINALIAGFLLITEPSGAKMQLPLSLLQYSPFTNFLIPGIVLFLVNGAFAFITAVFAIFKLQNYPTLIVWQSILLVGWIVVQMSMIREFNFLHVTIGLIGLLLFMFGRRLNA